MAGNRPGLKLVKKTVRGKKGSVQRSYWVKSNPKAKGNNRTLAEKKPGFLRRHAGKIAGVAALAGAAYLGRNHLKGLAGGKTPPQLGPGHGAQHAGAPAGAAHSRFSKAKEAFVAHGKKHGEKLTNWRRGEGADLMHRMANVAGSAGAEHLGSKFGHTAGTAIGGMFGGPVGAGVGGFLGGQAGSFIAGRRAAPHIKRGAEWLGNRMRR